MKNIYINEVWKPYHREHWKKKVDIEVSNFGNIYQDTKKLVGKPVKIYDLAGYKVFTILKKNGKNDLLYLHRMVAELFLEHDPERPYVAHLDFDKSNNHVSNLKYVTRKELFIHNRDNPAKQKPTYSKLNEAKVRIIKRKIFDPNRKTRMRIIAKQYGISEMQLYRIKRGENWGHVTDW